MEASTMETSGSAGIKRYLTHNLNGEIERDERGEAVELDLAASMEETNTCPRSPRDPQPQWTGGPSERWEGSRTAERRDIRYSAPERAPPPLSLFETY